MAQPEADQHLPVAHGHTTVHNHPPYSSPTPVDACDHRAVSPPFSSVRVQSQARWPEGQETSKAPSSTGSASRPHSALSTAHATGWCTDSFIAAYESYFIPCSLNDRRSDHKALAPELREHHPDTPHQAISEPASRYHSTSTHSTIGVSASNTNTQCPQGVDLDLDATYVTQSRGGEPLVRLGLPAVVARIDREPSHNAKGAANDGCAHKLGVDARNQLLELPATIYSSMHPVPPKLSLYSELAHAPAAPPSALIDDRMLSSGDRAVANPRTAIASAFTDTSLHPYRFGETTGTYSTALVHLTAAGAPQPAIGNSENEFVHIFEESLDNVQPSSADIGSLLLGADSAEGWGSMAISMNECARITLEGITRSDRLLSRIDSLLQSLGVASRPEGHDTPTSSF